MHNHSSNRHKISGIYHHSEKRWLWYFETKKEFCERSSWNQESQNVHMRDVVLSTYCVRQFTYIILNNSSYAWHTMYEISGIPEVPKVNDYPNVWRNLLIMSTICWMCWMRCSSIKNHWSLYHYMLNYNFFFL